MIVELFLTLNQLNSLITLINTNNSLLSYEKITNIWSVELNLVMLYYFTN